MDKTVIFLLFLSVFFVTGLKDIGKLNLVKVDWNDVVYKRLMITLDGVLSAPPLVILDILKLKNYKCFDNIRSNRISLAIPIMFWNQTYMDKITKGINMINFFKKFNANMSNMILPPSGIVAYRLNWRRKSESISNYFINIDSSWYTTQFDYVLPKTHDFIIEFYSTNSTNNLCNETKRKLLEEDFQSQELAVVFMTKKVSQQNISKIFVTIKDLKATKMFNETDCRSKEKCYVSYKYAEKWSYEVSANVMNNLNVVHLTLQKDIYDAVLNYLCKDKVPISEIESQTITKLIKDSSNEMGCAVAKKVYATLQKLCLDRSFDPNYYYNQDRCYSNNRFYEEEVIISMNSTKNFDDRNVFTIPVKRF